MSRAQSDVDGDRGILSLGTRRRDKDDSPGWTVSISVKGGFGRSEPHLRRLR